MTRLTHIELEKAANVVNQKTNCLPSVALILGSGLGELADKVQDPVVIPFSEIPYFPKATVEGHAGRLVLGKLSGVRVAVFQGRVHYYEGYAMHEVTFPIRLAWTLGARTLIVTNAAGGLNPDFKAGNLMLISDHLNLTGSNPLVGPNDDKWGPRFPGMANTYSPGLRKIASEAAKQETIMLQEGVYAALSGPSYETLAEIKLLRMVGADAVGMSTVPEVIAARHMNMEVLGISCITNLLSIEKAQEVTHNEVIETGKKVAAIFQRLVLAVLLAMGSKL